MAFYDTVRLEKGMYNTPGKSFTQVLEELDPSASYENTEFAGLDAYQRQLKRFDIKVGGRGSDVVEKFFQSTDSAALFPEYVARAVTQGMESANILPIWWQPSPKLTAWITAPLPLSRRASITSRL